MLGGVPLTTAKGSPVFSGRCHQASVVRAVGLVSSQLHHSSDSYNNKYHADIPSLPRGGDGHQGNDKHMRRSHQPDNVSRSRRSAHSRSPTILKNGPQRGRVAKKGQAIKKRGRVVKKSRNVGPRRNGQIKTLASSHYSSLLSPSGPHSYLPITNLFPETTFAKTSINDADARLKSSLLEKWTRHDPGTNTLLSCDAQEWSRIVFNQIAPSYYCRIVSSWTGTGVPQRPCCQKDNNEEFPKTLEDMCMYHHIAMRYLNGVFLLKNFIRLPFKEGLLTGDNTRSLLIQSSDVPKDDPWSDGYARWRDFTKWSASNLGTSFDDPRSRKNIETLWRCNQNREMTDANEWEHPFDKTEDSIYAILRFWSTPLMDDIFTNPHELDDAHKNRLTVIISEMLENDSIVMGLQNRQFAQKALVRDLEASQQKTRVAVSALLKDPNAYARVLEQTFRNPERFEVTHDGDRQSADEEFWKAITGGCGTFYTHTVPWYWRERTDEDVNPTIFDISGGEPTTIKLNTKEKIENQHPHFGNQDDLPEQGLLPMSNLSLLHRYNAKTLARKSQHLNPLIRSRTILRYIKDKKPSDMGQKIFGGSLSLPDDSVAWGYTPGMDPECPIIDYFKRPPGRNQAPQLPLDIDITQVSNYHRSKYDLMIQLLFTDESKSTLKPLKVQAAIIDEALKDQLIIAKGDVLQLLIRDEYLCSSHDLDSTISPEPCAKLRGFYDGLKHFLILDGDDYDPTIGTHPCLKDGRWPTTAELAVEVLYEPEILFPFSAWSQIPQGSTNYAEYESYLLNREWGGLLKSGFISCPPMYTPMGADDPERSLLVKEELENDHTAFKYGDYEDNTERINGDSLVGNVPTKTYGKPLCHSVTHRSGAPELFKVFLTTPALYERAFGDYLMCPRRLRRLTMREVIETYLGGGQTFKSMIQSMERDAKKPGTIPHIPEEFWDHLFLGDLWCHDQFEAEEESVYKLRWVLYKETLGDSSKACQYESSAVYAPYPFSLYYGCHYYPKGREKALKWLTDNFKPMKDTQLDSVFKFNESNYRPVNGAMKGPQMTQLDANRKHIVGPTSGLTVLYRFFATFVPMKSKVGMKNPVRFDDDDDAINYRPCFDSTERKVAQSTRFQHDALQIHHRKEIFPFGFSRHRPTEDIKADIRQSLQSGQMESGVHLLDTLLKVTPKIGEQSNHIGDVKEQLLTLLDVANKKALDTNLTVTNQDALAKVRRLGALVERAYADKSEKRHTQPLSALIETDSLLKTIGRNSSMLKIGGEDETDT